MTSQASTVQILPDDCCRSASAQASPQRLQGNCLSALPTGALQHLPPIAAAPNLPQLPYSACQAAAPCSLHCLQRHICSCQLAAVAQLPCSAPACMCCRRPLLCPKQPTCQPSPDHAYCNGAASATSKLPRSSTNALRSSPPCGPRATPLASATLASRVLPCANPCHFSLCKLQAALPAVASSLVILPARATRGASRIWLTRSGLHA